MPLFWQTANRFRRSFNGLPVWSLPVLVALMIVIGSVAIWKTQQSTTDSSLYLFDGQRVSDVHLGPMLQALAKADLREYQVEHGRIEVPRDKAALYLSVLAEADVLPAGLERHRDAAIIDRKIWETHRDWQVRLNRAFEKDLAAVLRSMPGIDEATVHYDQMESQGLKAERFMTATVAIRTSDSHVLDRHQVRAIRHHVARAGMQPKDVVVTDLRAGRVYAGELTDNDAIVQAEEYRRLKRNVEHDWEQKVHHVLQKFVPDAEVVVDVDLAENPLELRDLSGVVAPQRLAVSVGVPERHLVSIWQAKQPSVRQVQGPTEDELQALRERTITDIRESVLALIPEYIDMASAVTVTVFPGVATQQNVSEVWQPLAAWHQLSRRQRGMSIVAAALTFAGLALTVVAKLWRTRPPRHATISIDSYRAESSESTAQSAQAESEAAPRLNEQQLREALTGLVREDPDGAAEILHRWIDRAG